MFRLRFIIILALLCWGAAAKAAFPAPIIVLNARTIIWESVRTNGIVESNETITCAITLENRGRGHATNISATLLAGSGIAPVTTMQTYGDMPTNGAPVTRDFTFTVPWPVGRAAQVQLVLRTGTNEAGAVVFDVPVGDTATNLTRWSRIDLPGGALATQGPASEYPSTIQVAGLIGTVVGLRVTLHNYAHEFPEDMNALLVGPTGTNVMLLSDCGGFATITNVNLTFDTAITNLVANATEIYSGTYSASDVNYPNYMEEPAPTSPAFGTYLSQFKKTEPNGDWKLYLYDTRYEDVGKLLGGWSLTITVLKPPRFAVQNNGDGRVRLSLSGMGNRSFNIDYSTNLVDWQVLGQVSGTVDPAVIFDNFTGPPRRYYRARRNTP